jgi:hypothetical protein
VTRRFGLAVALALSACSDGSDPAAPPRLDAEAVDTGAKEASHPADRDAAHDAAHTLDGHAADRVSNDAADAVAADAADVVTRDVSGTVDRDAADAAGEDIGPDGPGPVDAGGQDVRDGAEADRTDDGGCIDMCPAPNGGVTIQCKKRFFYGVNYAWSNGGFGADFGGVATWGVGGVSARRAACLADLRDMRDHGVDVVRWWVFPGLRGEGVVFDAGGTPTGLGGTAVEDIGAALDLAAQAGVYIQFTLFSFDNFRADRMLDGGVLERGVTPIVVDNVKRQALMEKVVRPFADAVARSPNRDRVLSWDVINEPEWAISGSNPYGDPAYDPNAELIAVNHAQMETFVADSIRALRGASDARITVGGAAIKWAKAWSRVDVDFYTFHLYGWVHQYFPYTRPPSQYGVTDKPVVIGEFPFDTQTAFGAPYDAFVKTLFDIGYAGALSWAMTDGDWNGVKPAIKAFADARGCIVHY